MTALFLFLYFRLFNIVDSKQMFQYKFCGWLYSNCGPLVLETTALSTEPQPPPKVLILLRERLEWDQPSKA